MKLTLKGKDKVKDETLGDKGRDKD